MKKAVTKSHDLGGTTMDDPEMFKTDETFISFFLSQISASLCTTVISCSTKRILKNFFQEPILKINFFSALPMVSQRIKLKFVMQFVKLLTEMPTWIKLLGSLLPP